MQENQQEYRFVAADMSMALRLLGDALGPDAILLSSRTVAEGVEVVALPPGADLSAIQDNDEDVPVTPEVAAPDMNAAASRLAKSIEALGPGQDPAASYGDAQAFENLQHELQQVRQMLQSKLALANESASVLPNPLQYTLLNRIAEMGLPVPLARAVTEAVDCSGPDQLEQAWQQCLLGLARRLPIDTSDPVASGGVFAVVGPSGAGKSTAIVKMASRYLLNHSPRDIAMISLDSWSTGSRATLENFSRISKIAFTAINDATELPDAVSRASRSKLVLIDCPSLNAEDPEAARAQQVLKKLGSRLKLLLALPAYASQSWLARRIEQYRSTYCIGCILTHVDATGSPGQALSVLMDAHLPLLYSSHGSLRPDRLQVANAADLLALMAGGGLYQRNERKNPVNMPAEDASGLATG